MTISTSPTQDERLIVVEPYRLPAIEHIPSTHLIFDISAINEIDSRLVARLMAIREACGALRVSLCGATKQARVILALLGLDRIMAIEAA